MKDKKLDKRVSAYADGALEGARRERIELELERDPMLRETLRRTESLGRLVRESWNEGPPAPPVDFLVASLRVEIAAIDRERRARPAWQQGLERARIAVAHWFGPAPIAASAALAFLLALVMLPQSTEMPATLPVVSPTHTHGNVFPAAPPMSRQPIANGTFSNADFSTDVYDFSPTERPAMIFREKDGSTLLWLLDEDGSSWWRDMLDRWG